MHQRKCKIEINQDAEEETDGEEDDDEPGKKMSKKKTNQNCHPILKKKMIVALLWTELIYLKVLMSFLEFSVNMVHVWCK